MKPETPQETLQNKNFSPFPFIEGYFCLPVSGSEFKIRNKFNKIQILLGSVTPILIGPDISSANKRS
jgi:hypothetical protein